MNNVSVRSGAVYVPILRIEKYSTATRFLFTTAEFVLIDLLRWDPFWLKELT
jgi:hypothetical protein